MFVPEVFGSRACSRLGRRLNNTDTPSIGGQKEHEQPEIAFSTDGVLDKP